MRRALAAAACAFVRGASQAARTDRCTDPGDGAFDAA
jgi:hypothetical protein